MVMIASSYINDCKYLCTFRRGALPCGLPYAAGSLQALTVTGLCALLGLPLHGGKIFAALGEERGKASCPVVF
jgi:hypothetical protein